MKACITLCTLLLTIAVQSPAGAGVYVGGINPPHPTYGYDGTNRRVDIGLCPSKPEHYVAAYNVAAALNRRVRSAGNVDTTSADRPASNQTDFEETLLHEVGHAIGFAHTLVADGGIPARFGPNGVRNLTAGPDGVIGTEDDALGDDIADLFWFPTVTPDNSPFIAPLVADATTITKDRLQRVRPGTMPWAPSDRIARLFGLPDTFPMTTDSGPIVAAAVVRRPAPDDLTMIEFMESGPDSLAGTSDDYDLFFYVVGPQEVSPYHSCIVIAFPPVWQEAPTVVAIARTTNPEHISGFAPCYDSVPGPSDPATADRCYGETLIEFNRNVNWFYSTVDTSNGEGVFRRNPDVPNTIIDLQYDGQQSRLLMTYNATTYQYETVTIHVETDNGEPFPPGAVLYPVFLAARKECEILFFATPTSQDTITALEIGGLTQVTARLEIAPITPTASCELPVRVSVPGAGTPEKTLIAVVDDGTFIFSHGFE